MSARTRIVLFAADELVVELFSELLSARGFEVERAMTVEGACDALERSGGGVLLVEDAPPVIDAQAVLWWVRQLMPYLEVVVVASHGLAARAIEAEQAGAYDFLQLPLESMDTAIQTLERAAAKHRAVRTNEGLTKYLQQADAQIDAVNQHVERLVGERSKQLTYLSQANTQIDTMNQELGRLISERERQVSALEAANARVAQMNQELESLVAERTRQLVETNARLHELTMTDDLTGLYNQRWLHTRLDEEYARARRHSLALAVLMLDVDRFKNVNDSNDHIVGSAVLRRVGEILKQGVRGIDVAVRYGGDEFCVVLPQTTLGGAMAVAERLRLSIAKADVGDEDIGKLGVTISIGVASLADCEATTGKELLQSADKALYLAKENGRNRVVGVNGKGTVGVAG
ncbi:MAG: diguanylate cyclase [Clostridia bacterium]|nr:diguanylate cyclase [Deltaproteobacteria bacterium]